MEAVGVGVGSGVGSVTAASSASTGMQSAADSIRAVSKVNSRFKCGTSKFFNIGVPQKASPEGEAVTEGD